MRLLNFCNKLIEYSFYLLFLLVPLVFWKDTSELFEFNKMWITFVLVILIVFGWITKMIIMKKFWVQKTPLDIPILLFLVSQIISTFHSLDTHVSLWGYYSRFNGGLFSILSYIFLYYAFLSNFSFKKSGLELTARTMVKRLIYVSLGTATITALWGLPSHFGYDPTCLIFRGTLDISCWTSDFQPKIRIFSTLGQPAWLGAYLAILSPLFFAFLLDKKNSLKKMVLFFLLSVVFYLDIVYTKGRAALFAFWISTIIFFAYFLWSQTKIKAKKLSLETLPKSAIFSLVAILTITILAYLPYQALTKQQKTQTAVKNESVTSKIPLQGGGTESGKIRLLVWRGAIDAWLHNPIFGTGVETFAFAYYKYRPAEHNITSEWNYLYNKAHNEYLNYLATTGIVGLATYLSIIILFLYRSYIFLKKKFDPLVAALVAEYITILVTNFFGFSVVIVNLYLFLIPAFIFVITNDLGKVFVKNKSKSKDISLSFVQKADVFVVGLVAFYLLYILGRFWLADVSYAEGSGLGRAGDYIKGYSLLHDAVSLADFEPTYKDELSSNDAILAVTLLSQPPKDEKQASQAAKFADGLTKEAIFATSQVTNEHPNNVVFWKTKVRVYYALSQIDPKYLIDALSAIKKAKALAPTDAGIYYNLGLLEGQSNNPNEAVKSLQEAARLKPNYTNAYYALGLFYRQLATNSKGVVIDNDLEQKAIMQMEYILKNIDPKNQDAKDALDTWTGKKNE